MTIVATNITNVTLAEAADAANWDDIGGGPGSGQSTDQPIEGAENRGRRVDNNIRGMSFDPGATLEEDASGTGVHIGWWSNVFQPALIGSGGLELILGSGATPTTSPWSGWTFSAANYPETGGWIRIWLDPTITRDFGTGTLNLASLRQFGIEFDLGDISGTSDSCHIDRIDYTATGLLIEAGTAGTPTTFADFVVADAASRYGVVIERDGVIFVYARLTIGDATLTVFNDSNFNIVFADQVLVASDFMGITIDLQNGSTDVDWANAAIASGGATRGDIIVTGTSGAFNCDNISFTAIRVFTLTSSCIFANCTISGSGQIDTGSGADLHGTSVVGSDADAALLWNVNLDPNGELDDMDFTRDPEFEDTNHAIEFGSSTPSSVQLTGQSYTAYGPDGATFDTENIDSGTDILTTDALHGFTTEDPIWVNSEGGTETPGLTNATRYFINAQSTSTLTFHLTAAAALADTGRVDLTASGGGSGETWSLFHGWAAIFNDTGGALTIDVTTGDTPTIRNGTGASTTVNNVTNMTVTVREPGGVVVQGARVRIEEDPAGTLISEGETNASGVYTDTFPVADTPQDVNVIVRLKGFKHFETKGTIQSTGLSSNVAFQPDPSVDLP